MNAYGDLTEENGQMAEDLWNRLDDADIPDIQEYEKTTEYFLEQIREECDSSLGRQDMTYDCQDMPDDAREDFFDSHEAGNDCHVTHYVEEGTPAGDFLIEEGFGDGDEVIIKHWW